MSFHPQGWMCTRSRSGWEGFGQRSWNLSCSLDDFVRQSYFASKSHSWRQCPFSLFISHISVRNLHQLRDLPLNCLCWNLQGEFGRQMTQTGRVWGRRPDQLGHRYFKRLVGAVGGWFSDWCPLRYLIVTLKY